MTLDQIARVKALRRQGVSWHAAALRVGVSYYVARSHCDAVWACRRREQVNYARGYKRLKSEGRP